MTRQHSCCATLAAVSAMAALFMCFSAAMSLTAANVAQRGCWRGHSAPRLHKNHLTCQTMLVWNSSCAVLHDHFEADFTLVRVGITTVNLQHSYCMPTAALVQQTRTWP